MGSIDRPGGDDARARLAAFFERELVPAARALRERGVSFFPAGADPAAPTYWRRRDDAGDYLDTLDPEETADRLRVLWADHPELLALVDPLLELARAMEREAGEQGPELSPYVYAMY
jgi:hypothetical protein